MIVCGRCKRDSQLFLVETYPFGLLCVTCIKELTSQSRGVSEHGTGTRKEERQQEAQVDRKATTTQRKRRA